jgi:fumarate hydratase subunit beta
MSGRIVRVQSPLGEETVETLRAGDVVRISGVVYTARDAAHKRIVEALDAGQAPPFELSGQIAYYVGPTPARPGEVIGSAGPTTSCRMDSYAPRLLEAGLKGMIGKGNRSPAVIEAMKKFRAVYFAAVGGAGALISKCIKSSEIIAYEDLGAEAVRRLVVEDFPAIVANDVLSGDIYETGRKKYQRL